MSATLILPSSNLIPDIYLNWVVGQHRNQNVEDLEIIIVNYGERPTPEIPFLNGFYCIPDDGGKVNVSKLRNLGAKIAKGEWLFFSDIDTIYKNQNCFKEMISLGNFGVIPVVAGRTRQDFMKIDSQEPCGYIYPCNHGPVLIKKSFFYGVGGYCEKYSGWGFEDCDISLKMGNGKILSYSAHGWHILEIHICYMNHERWQHGISNNLDIWNERNKLTIEQMIQDDLFILMESIK